MRGHATQPGTTGGGNQLRPEEEGVREVWAGALLVVSAGKGKCAGYVDLGLVSLINFRALGPRGILSYLATRAGE